MKNAPVIAVGIAFASLSVFAQESLSREQSVQRALEGNRDLVAARVKVEEAKARLQQAGLWPNPELEVGNLLGNPVTSAGEYALAATVSQPFSISGRIAARKGLARVDIERTLAGVAELERGVVGEVRRAFTTYFAVEEQIKLQLFLIGLNEELLGATKVALERAQVSEKDVNAILIASQQARQRLEVLKTQRRSRSIELNKLMGQPPDRDFLVAGELELQPPPEPSTLSLDQVLTRRPDFAAAQLDVALARSEQQLAKAERIDDWRIGAGYELDKSVIDGAPRQAADQFLGLKLTIPLPWFDRKQGRLRETVALEDRAQKTAEALRIQIAQEVADSLNRANTLAPLLASYQGGLLKRAEDNVTLVENGYRQGLTGIVEVIQSRQQFAELKASYIDTLREYDEAVVDLELAAGIFPSTIQLSQPTEVNTP